MGLSMIFAVAPMCELTSERTETMKYLIDKLDRTEFEAEEPWADFCGLTLEQNREKLLDYVVEVCQNYNSAARDVGWLRVDPMNYILGVTGAPSHGDPPTDSYDAFHAVACFEQVFDQLKAWAIEDYTSKSNQNESENQT